MHCMLIIQSQKADCTSYGARLRAVLNWWPICAVCMPILVIRVTPPRWLNVSNITCVLTESVKNVKNSIILTIVTFVDFQMIVSIADFSTTITFRHCRRRGITTASANPISSDAFNDCSDSRRNSQTVRWVTENSQMFTFRQNENVTNRMIERTIERMTVSDNHLPGADPKNEFRIS